MLGRSLLCLAALGCVTRPPPSTDRADMVVALAEAAGWTVSEGAYVTSLDPDCCLPVANCQGMNPGTPYGVWSLPPAPGAEVADVDVYWPFGPAPAGTSRDFRLRPDEVVLWLGTAPPRSKYFGQRSYLSTRQQYDGTRRIVAGSLGPALNHLTAEALIGVAMWDTELAIVTSSDAGAERRVHGWLEQSGLPKRHVLADHIPADLVTLGLHEEADTLFIFDRIAVADNPTALATWRADPPVRLLRLTPPRALPAEPHALQPLPVRGSGTDESAWADAMDALEVAIVDRWPGRPTLTLESDPYFLEAIACIDDPGVCAGDIYDRYAAIIQPVELGLFEHIVMFGVNHERTGKASYSSASLHTIERQIGVVDFDSSQMVGSARLLLPDHALVDDLYTVVVARDCEDFELPCLVMPETCPGAALSEGFKLTYRAYLDPLSGAAPLPEELVLDRGTKFFPP
jgi:hypothetical protein